MEFLNSAHNLELFTIERSVKDIPKTYTFILRVPLCESARTINKLVTYANSIFPDSIKDQEQKNRMISKRLEYQRMAVMEIQNMLEILTIASERIPIKDTVLCEWTELILKEEKAIKNWHEADKKRYT